MVRGGGRRDAGVNDASGDEPRHTSEKNARVRDFPPGGGQCTHPERYVGSRRAEAFEGFSRALPPERISSEVSLVFRRVPHIRQRVEYTHGASGLAEDRSKVREARADPRRIHRGRAARAVRPDLAMWIFRQMPPRLGFPPSAGECVENLGLSRGRRRATRAIATAAVHRSRLRSLGDPFETISRHRHRPEGPRARRDGVVFARDP